MPQKTSVIGAAVSAAAAIVAFLLSYWKSRALDKKKAQYQTELEAVKTTYQGDLERRKTELQKELEEFKADIADQAAAANARRGYEYDARKRLYAQVEPLLFQLFESAEGAFHAVSSLARTQRNADLPAWLSAKATKYYIRSMIHRLFAPLAILRLIQRSTTLIDLNLDPSIRLRYALLKECYLTWTDDFEIAKLEPELEYDPGNTNWIDLRDGEPAIYWRQGIVIGHLDRLIDSMTVDDGPIRRSMNFGQFEKLVGDGGEFAQVYDLVEDVFSDFSFPSRPVLGRILLIYACLMHTLMSVYGNPAADSDVANIFSRWLDADDQGKMLRWWGDTDPDVFAIVRPYVLRRIKQAITPDYVKF